MKLKRIISSFLCAVLMMTAIPSVCVSAADKKDENAETAAMRNAIVEIKKRISIPDTLDKFDYSTTTKYETTYYNFVWSREKKERSYSYTEESISVDYFNGFISNYRYYNRNGNSSGSKPSFGKLSSAKQDEYAKKYLYQLNPGLKGNAVITRNSSETDLFGTAVSYSVSRVESGIEFNGNSGSIRIDRDTGKLLNYSLKWWNDAVLPDASKKLSVEKVSDIYASRKPLKATYDLFYKSEYDEERKIYVSTPFILAVYSPTVGGENMIDAITGKYTSYYADREKYSYTDAYIWNTDYDDDECFDEEEAEYDSAPDPSPDGNYLTEAEKAALEKEDKYISYEQALKIIRDDPYIVFNKELVLSSNNISWYTDENGENQPMRSLRFRYSTQDDTKDSISLSVNLDAYTGKVINYSKNYSYGSKSPNRNTTVLNIKNSTALAEKAAKHFIGTKASEYKYDNNVKLSEHYTVTQGDFRFTRYVNGLPTSFDGMSVDVDSRGEVLGFNYSYHNLKFPKADLISEKEAYVKLFKNMKPELYYHGFTDLQLKSHVYLTYEFDSSYMIDAISGERITYYGTAYYTDKKEEQQKEAVLYKDIKGHKYEKEITSLWNYGIRMTDSDKLVPDGEITIGEFLTLCDKVNRTNYARRIYPDIRKYNSKTKQYDYERNPELDKKLTCGELAKIYVYIYKNEYYSAAGIKGIYAQTYKNITSNNEYCGYIAMAKHFKLIADGSEFPYTKTVSRAQCLKYMYDYIAGDSVKNIYEIVKI